MSCPCSFEPKIQVTCALELVTIVRAGQLIDKKSEVLKHIGCIVGSAGAYLSDEPEVFAASAPSADLEACCNEIEAQCGGEGATINPAVLAILLKLAELLIAKYL